MTYSKNQANICEKSKTREFIKKMVVSVTCASLVLGLSSCGLNSGKNAEFKPKLPTDTACTIRVAGSYSNFESLESEFERFDGRGYPDGLKGEEIPEEARIIAVADAYDAMTSNRSYRGLIPQDVVKGEFEKGSGTQFDPRFAAIMLDIIKEDVDYKLHEQ